MALAIQILGGVIAIIGGTILTLGFYKNHYNNKIIGLKTLATGFMTVALTEFISCFVK